MAWLFGSIFLVVVWSVVATPDAQITAIAKLDARQQSDPSALGWLSTSGASTFSDLRRCDFPDHLTRSGSYAQCCESGKPCGFFTSCSANTLFASAVTVPCDNGFCNTGVIISTIGAQSGASFLGCWATDLGTAAFTLVQDIGSAPTATPTSKSVQSNSDSSSGRTSDSATSSSGTSTVASTSQGSGESAPTSSNAAVGILPLSGVAGLFAGFLAFL